MAGRTLLALAAALVPFPHGTVSAKAAGTGATQSCDRNPAPARSGSVLLQRGQLTSKVAAELEETGGCPPQCKEPACVAGGGHNGGLPLAGDVCEHVCSQQYAGIRYCGDGAAYTGAGSVDCRRCAPETATMTCSSQCGAPACVAGGGHNGGVPLAGNVCERFCSQKYAGTRYCGNGAAYSSGGSLDCRGCATEDQMRVFIIKRNKGGDGICSLGELIIDKDTCAKAAQTLKLQDAEVTEVSTGDSNYGCMYANDELTFRDFSQERYASASCKPDSWCICNQVERIRLGKPGKHAADISRSDLTRMLRCDTVSRQCVDAFRNPVRLVHPWTKAVLESNLECPARAFIWINARWDWKRVSGNLDTFQDATSGGPSVTVMINEEVVAGGSWTKDWTTDGYYSSTTDFYFAEGNVVSVRSELVKHTDLYAEDEFAGELDLIATSAHIACEEKKLCIKTLAKDDQLRVDNALQLRCLNGELHTAGCDQWRQCLERAGVKHHLLVLLKAVVQHPDDFGLVEEAEAADAARPAAPGAPALLLGARMGGGVELAQVPDQERCIAPEHMDSEAWYCLCLDEMDKACHEIRKNIPRYDHRLCLQANGCYDPFEIICGSWKSERRRCEKLKVYTQELEKHQRAALVQRGNRSASVSANGAGGGLDTTVSSKQHQCNH